MPYGLRLGDDVVFASFVALGTEQPSNVTALRHLADRLTTSLFVSFVLRLYAEGCVPPHTTALRAGRSHFYGDRAPMIATAKKRTSPKRFHQPDWHNRFLDMLPTIRRYARCAFHDLPRTKRDEAVDDVVVDTFVAYRRLVDQGRESLAYPTALARYGVAHVRYGRTVGVKLNSKDVLSRYAQVRREIQVERLDQVDEATGDWREVAVEDRRTCPAEIATFRIDFAAWLRTLPTRHSRIAHRLAAGETTSRVAELFRMSAARVSQIRRELHAAWLAFQSEAVPVRLTAA